MMICGATRCRYTARSGEEKRKRLSVDVGRRERERDVLARYFWRSKKKEKKICEEVSVSLAQTTHTSNQSAFIAAARWLCMGVSRLSRVSRFASTHAFASINRYVSAVEPSPNRRGLLCIRFFFEKSSFC